MNFESFKNSDFYFFFNLSEIKTSKSFPLYIKLKPGGFQEHIDLEIVLEEHKEIKQAILMLDRFWIGNEVSINPFGKDIAKSFIDLMLPSNPTVDFKESLITSLWNLKGSNEKIICIDKVVEAWESSNVEVKHFLDVYRGSMKGFKKIMNKIELTMENIKDDNKERLKITMRF
ncbi:MAG: hypothetical protein ACFFAS_17965 [Promethearchaeota archaeon]